MWLGSGVIGGIGLGLGYISPVSTLVKWFPDRRGMATGMAIMGFGGGAMIGAPLANMLMNYFKTPTAVGVWQTFLAMGAIYFFFMMVGAFRYRMPPAGWRPDGWTPPSETKSMITAAQRASEGCAQDAAVLADLVGAVPERFRRHRRDRHGLADAAGNLRRQADRPARAQVQRAHGRSESRHRRDRRRLRRPAVAVQHRRPVLLGVAVGLYRAQEHLLHVLPARHRALRAGAVRRRRSAESCCSSLAFCIILSMYGGGFATVPAYLADMFGTQFVGAIHGRLLTAWSTAGIIGPVVVNYIREAQLAAGVPRDHLYDYTMYILCGMLVVGLICNFLVKPVDPKWYMSADEVAKLQAASARARPRTRLVRHRQRRLGRARPRCSGPSSASRSPGACGSRS